MNGYGKLTALFVRRVANGEKIEPRSTLMVADYT